tara:strand:- start:299 stop:538 length:240 start_codon:yes stop_codon:yes gene_type:complete
MKVLLKIALCLVLLTGAVSAAEIEKLAKETTVNALVANGWNIIFVSSSDYIITYTLMNYSGEIVTCKVLSNDKITCFKP